MLHCFCCVTGLCRWEMPKSLSHARALGSRRIYIYIYIYTASLTDFCFGVAGARATGSAAAAFPSRPESSKYIERLEHLDNVDLVFRSRNSNSFSLTGSATQSFFYFPLL